MVSKKGGLKRAERRQPEQIFKHPKAGVSEDSEKPTYNPHAHDQASSSAARSKAARKRGHASQSLAKAKLERGVEKADRLRAKASKRMHQNEKKKRLKESS
ncbi:hypothetical protein CBS101457_006153 [Exobasidium rhododendri]|nr:hypothetical protein CBS101457_006153 [Exobasidium rhododendri]